MPNIHFIGIGGAGLSAIATVLLQQGFTVSGSDMQPSAMTARLANLGATVFSGHRPANLPANLDAVIISSAIRPDNPELVEAYRRGLKVVKRAEWLGQMMQSRAGIAIAGTHGKTTTTAMTAFLFQQAKLDPTYIIGGFVPQLNTNAAAGAGEAFIIEADEYDHMFLGLRPTVAVVTIVEWDHPDIYPTPQSFQQAFVNFVQLVPPAGLVIANGDDIGALQVAQQAQAQVVTYGFTKNNDWRAVEVQPNQRGGHDFTVMFGEMPMTAVSLAIPGRHNVANALAVLAIAYQQGLDLTHAAAILGQFTGVGRRFEVKGEANGITVIDDYAHHPTEIKATLAAARARFAQRPIWAVFQPHTFSRTLSLLDDFAGSFDQADHVLIVDIFASRETDARQVHSKNIIEKMTHPDAYYIGPLREAADYLLGRLAAPAVLITLGAGDGYRIGEWVLEGLNAQS